MAYETKVMLIAIGKIVSKADSIEEIYEAIEEMANAAGMVLKPLEDKDTGKQKGAVSDEK